MTSQNQTKGNLTGITQLSAKLMAKRLGLLRYNAVMHDLQMIKQRNLL